MNEQDNKAQLRIIQQLSEFRGRIDALERLEGKVFEITRVINEELTELGKETTELRDKQSIIRELVVELKGSIVELEIHRITTPVIEKPKKRSIFNWWKK